MPTDIRENAAKTKTPIPKFPIKNEFFFKPVAKIIKSMPPIIREELKKIAVSTPLSPSLLKLVNSKKLIELENNRMMIIAGFKIEAEIPEIRGISNKNLYG